MCVCILYTHICVFRPFFLFEGLLVSSVLLQTTGTKKHIYIYTHTYVCLYIYIYIHTHNVSKRALKKCYASTVVGSTHISPSMPIVCVCSLRYRLHIYIYTHTHAYLSLYVYICISLSLYICIYLYVYTHISVYIYIYIYIYGRCPIPPTFGRFLFLAGSWRTPKPRVM